MRENEDLIDNARKVVCDTLDGCHDKNVKDRDAGPRSRRVRRVHGGEDLTNLDPKRHIELTGVNNEVILGNLKELLTKRFNVHIRMPLLKGINDSNEEIEKVVEFLTPFKDYKNFQGIDLLPYHKMGVGKYTQLDMEYPIKGDPSLSARPRALHTADALGLAIRTTVAHTASPRPSGPSARRAPPAVKADRR